MMRYLVAVCIYTILTISFLQGWLWLAALSAFVYSVVFGAFLLLPLAFLLDGYFGNFDYVPTLSIMAIGWYLVVWYVRPRLVSVQLLKKYESTT